MSFTTVALSSRHVCRFPILQAHIHTHVLKRILPTSAFESRATFIPPSRENRSDLQHSWLSGD